MGQRGMEATGTAVHGDYAPVALPAAWWGVPQPDGIGDRGRAKEEERQRPGRMHDERTEEQD